MGAGSLERAYQEKRKTAEWTDAKGVKHKVSLHHWLDDLGKGTKYKVARNLPGIDINVALHIVVSLRLAFT